LATHGTTLTDAQLAFRALDDAKTTLKALEEARDILDRQNVPTENRYVPNPEYIEQYFQTPKTETEHMTESKHLPELKYVEDSAVEKADEILEQLKYNGLISKCGQYIYVIQYGDFSISRNPAYVGGYSKDKRNIVLNKDHLTEIGKLRDLYDSTNKARRAHDNLATSVRSATGTGNTVGGMFLDF